MDQNKKFQVTGFRLLVAGCWLLVFSSWFPLSAQTTNKKYLIYFTNKTGTPYTLTQPNAFLSQRSIQRRTSQNISIKERDLPVTPSYLDSIRNAGATILYPTKWFNGCCITADSETFEKVKLLTFVKNTHKLVKRLGLKSKPVVKFSENSTNIQPETRNQLQVTTPYGQTFTQASVIGAVEMHNAGYHGEGMIIAVLDAGFWGVDHLKCFTHLFTNNQILATHDFVDNQLGVYEDNSHGMQVLSLIAGYVPDLLIGTAYKAQFLLLRTEDVYSEQTIEEVNWLAGTEYADSAGADIITSSLGYSEFDDSTMNYTYNDMDGNTAIVTRAADIACSTGMLVISSAGNYGNRQWKYVGAPADADSVLSIGAISLDSLYAGFSSQGPTYDGRIKPDLCAPGLGVYYWSTSDTVVGNGSGTSYSAPIFAGLAAGFWQAQPQLTAFQVADALKRSGSQYSSPDAFKGYGIPNFNRAQNLSLIIPSISDSYFHIQVYPNPFSNNIDIIIESQKGSRLKIWINDTSGKIVFRKKVNVIKDSKINISTDLNHLHNGIYWIYISDGKKELTAKVIKI